MEANASLRGLVNRNTGEAYWDYVKRLAAASGIDPQDSAAVRKFDRKRPKKMSNQEWENPAEADAKIGPKKDGATDMIYKPQTVVDLDTGAIVGAEMLPGDQADHQAAATSILEAQQNINAARGEALNQLTVQTATADKGYYGVDQLQALQQEHIKTVMGDPINNRRLDKLEPAEQRAVKGPAAARVASMAKHCCASGDNILAGLCTHLGLRRDAAGDLTRSAKSPETFQAGGGILQSFPTNAPTLRGRTPKQGAAIGRSAVGAFLQLLVLGLWALAVE